jgi:predicted DNA-binding transcriptional regulator YafY
MRRADRLLELIGCLKAKRLVKAEELAERLEVSVRTVYRDVAALQAQGLPIDGQAGVGYALRGPVHLPPLTFDHDQLEALALGLSYVEQVGDPELASAARGARGKIDSAWAGSLIPMPSARALRSHQPEHRRAPALGATLRGALRGRRVVELDYVDLEGQRTTRPVRPLALTAYSEGWLLIAWCELRNDFRVFRVDRVTKLAVTKTTFENQPGRDLATYLARNT